MKRVSWSNVFAVITALWIGATCTGCTTAQAYSSRQQPDRLKFVRAQPIVPGPFERGVWAQVEICLHLQADISAVRFAVADSIVDIDNRQLLYGVYAHVAWPEGVTPTIVIDNVVRYSSRVWSHEIVHVIAGVPDGDWRLAACVLNDGPYALPLREWLPPQTGA